mgnify:CR=1 FL=1
MDTAKVIEAIEINGHIEHLTDAIKRAALSTDSAGQALFRINEDLFAATDDEEIAVLTERAEDIAIQVELSRLETEALANALGAAIGAALAPMFRGNK